MLSKNKTKFIQSLKRKKNRDAHMLFIAEGEKAICELHRAEFRFHSIIGTEKMLSQFSEVECIHEEASIQDLAKISAFKSPPSIMAICHQNKSGINFEKISNELTIVLDDIQDPGNLGTIIRLVSWFGIKNIVCSHHTADCYNPKTIQASMGAIAHIGIHYTELNDFLMHPAIQAIECYGTFLEGESIYTTELNSRAALIVLGNEGQGISPNIEKLVNKKLFIPSFNNGNRVESLNVSIAAAIICSEFKRR